MKINKRIAAIIATGLVAITAFAQVGADRLVNAYSLITNTWATFKVGALSATTISTGNISATSLTVGAGVTMSGITSTNVSLDFGSAGTNATVILTQTISGIDTNDVAVVNIVSPHTSFVYNASVTAADTVTIRASNISITNAINQAATDARIIVFKY